MNCHVTAYIHFCHKPLQQRAEKMLQAEGFEISDKADQADIGIIDSVELATALATPTVVFVSSCTHMPYLSEKIYQLPRQFTGSDIKILVCENRVLLQEP